MGLLQNIVRRKPLSQVAGEPVPKGEGYMHLKRSLNVRDLTMLGIAAVIGAGIFSTIGKAAYEGGPGVIFLFVITAVTCGFTALCYAEFASRVQSSGSAYTYSYVTFGELVAWIIGWALILEYAIGNVVVAISWSSYFDNLLQTLGLHIPDWLLIDPSTAYQAHLNGDKDWIENAYNTAPLFLGHKLILNLPAFLIVVFITFLAYIGIKESKKSANAMVVFKLIVLLIVIVVGTFYINTNNYTPFMPNKFNGVLAGVSAVFYAYIGFDAISTTAEECEHPQRDLPRAMIYSLVFCTIVYILIALVLTGMKNYSEFKNVTDPLAFVFEGKSVWLNKLVSFSAIIATTGVLLVFQIGQPRIWMTMSRDGLLPKKFSAIHKKYRTPHFATIVTGLIVALPSLFINADLVTDLTSIGTLFAFALVCGGVMFLPKPTKTQKFKLPFINSTYILPFLLAGFIYLFRGRISDLLSMGWSNPFQELLFFIFLLFATLLTLTSFFRKLSLIPIMGLLCCTYLMVEIPKESWKVFFVWMFFGIIIYFLYGYWKSNLTKRKFQS